jgi:hypothetical protein
MQNIIGSADFFLQPAFPVFYNDIAGWGLDAVQEGIQRRSCQKHNKNI